MLPRKFVLFHRKNIAHPHKTVKAILAKRKKPQGTRKNQPRRKLKTIGHEMPNGGIKAEVKDPIRGKHKTAANGAQQHSVPSLSQPEHKRNWWCLNPSTHITHESPPYCKIDFHQARYDYVPNPAQNETTISELDKDERVFEAKQAETWQWLGWMVGWKIGGRKTCAPEMGGGGVVEIRRAWEWRQEGRKGVYELERRVAGLEIYGSGNRTRMCVIYMSSFSAAVWASAP